MSHYAISDALAAEFPSRADAEAWIARDAEGYSRQDLAELYETADAHPDWTTDEISRHLAVERDISMGPNTAAWLLTQSGR